MLIVVCNGKRRQISLTWHDLALVFLLVVTVSGQQDTRYGPRDSSTPRGMPWDNRDTSRNINHHQKHNRHHHDVDRTTVRTSWYEVNTNRGLRGQRQGVPRFSQQKPRNPFDYSRQGKPYHQPLQQSTPAGAQAPPPPRRASSSTRPIRPSSSRHPNNGYSRTRPSSSSFHGRPNTSQRWRPYNQGHPVHDSWSDIRTAHRPTNPGRRDKRPNIVLIVSDDQDVELGSLNYMPRLMNIMRDAGAYFPQAYTSTPMCCPSRSSMLTGMYIHNHEVYTNNDNCSSTLWQQTHERRTFATYLNDAGYRTGYFGKYLNKYNGSHVPVGWREWAGLLMNSKYYNYTVNRNNQWKKYGDQYPRDYYPHVITNDGIHFLETSKRMDPSPPIMMVLSYPAPHGPEDSAPEHAHLFFNATDHHTMAYDYAPNPDKQWILQFTGRMHDIQLKFTDVLMTKRLQTLQTVDESVQRIVNKLESLGELDNTYIFYTSDHGYHLGQFGLVKGKSMPFEFDIKVPFLVRGPGIKAGTQINNIALNVDLAPTFLDIAGIKPPLHMDGRSLLPLLKSTTGGQDKSANWRDTFLVESSGRLREEDALELRKQRREQRAQGLSAAGFAGPGLFTSKHERLELVCDREEYQSPCAPMQKWECVHDGIRWRLKKCRVKSKWRRRNCVCEPDLGMGFLVKLDSTERRKQRLFLKKHVTQDLKKYDAKFLKAFSDVDSSEVAEETLGRVQRNSRWYQGKVRRLMNGSRNKRSTSESFPEIEEALDYALGGDDDEIEVEVDESSSDPKDPVDAFVSEEEMRAIDHKIITIADELEGLETVSSTSATLAPGNNTSLDLIVQEDFDATHLEHGCRATETSVNCTDEVYHNPHAWKLSKVAIDDQIRRLRHQLFVLKDVRKHLRNSRPDSIESLDDYDYGDSPIPISPIDENFNNLDVGLTLNPVDDHASSGEGSGYVGLTQDTRDYIDFHESLGINNVLSNHTIIASIQPREETIPVTELPLGEDYDETPPEDYGETRTEEYGETLTEDVDFEDQTDTVPIVGEDESTIRGILEGEDIIIGKDYDVGGSRGYKNRNYVPERRRPKGFRDPLHTKHRNKHRGRNSNRRGDGFKSSSFEDTQIEHPDINSQFELYPVRHSIQVAGEPSTIDNETTPKQPICWCDKRMATKLAIQQERAKKRAERQRLKLERLKRKEAKMKRRMRKSKDSLATCNPIYTKLNCYQHDNDHWKTPPLWHDGKFCFCMNAPNNTYWCLRTINDTDNYLYCEFITGLVTYYDLTFDPYQLRNVAFTLSNSRLAELHHRLEKLRVCVGADECDNIPPSQRTEETPPVKPQSQVELNPSVMNNVVLPEKRLSKVERMQEREERRRLRKLSKKYRRNQLYESKNRHVLEAVGSGEHKVRLPRKSRIEKERRKERRRERNDRRRKKKSKKNKKLRH